MKWTRDTASSPTFTLPVLQDRVIGLKWFLLCVTFGATFAMQTLGTLPGDPMHYQRPLHQPWQRGVMEPWGFSAPGGSFPDRPMRSSSETWVRFDGRLRPSLLFAGLRMMRMVCSHVFTGSNCPQEKHWTCWNWHAENGQNANPNLSDEFLTKIWCILKNCLKVLAFMSLWSRNMWVTKQSLGCRMTWTARWNQPSKDLRTAAATAATLTGWWFCNLFRIKIWSYCHYLHGLKPPRKTIHHSAVSRWFALHQIWAWVEHGVPMDKNTICHVNYDKLSILWDWILTHTDLNHSMSFYIHHTDHKSDNSENIYKILKNLKNLLKSLPMHILHIPSQSSWCLAGCQLHATLALSLQQLGIFERYRVAVCQAISHEIGPVPIGSMYAIYGNIYHQYTPNVSIYTIHGSYGV